MSQPDAAALAVETVGMSMRFGAFLALDDVSIRFPAGGFHALLGENGAGKSTLVKCMMGFYQATGGQLMVADHEVSVPDPRAAHALGLGMVYQHFTLVPSLTAAENLVISRATAPPVFDWRKEGEALEAFMARMPFSVPLSQRVERMSAGEKQKLEILKQLYLGRRFLILDEPTSVLTPAEADEVLGLLRDLTASGAISVLMITHKFREVTAFADTVNVLRRGKHVGGGAVSTLSHGDMAEMMVGSALQNAESTRTRTGGHTVLSIAGLKAEDRSGVRPIEIERLDIKSGEIVGIAGVSGNGQVEFMEVLAGQRERERGDISVLGEPYAATRKQAHKCKVRYLPEEPLRNACAPRMSVAENLFFRSFDVAGLTRRTRFWLDSRGMQRLAHQLIGEFGIKTASTHSCIDSLSGGNVQRAVLARELSGEVDLLVISNPCFGLDFAAVREIRARILAARNAGTAVLLMSEDLDEILELADRILVMSEGRISFETPAAKANLALIGQHMAGHA